MNYYRITKMSGVFYGMEIYSVESDLENINTFVDEGTLVCLTDDIETFEDEMGVDVVTVEAEDE